MKMELNEALDRLNKAGLISEAEDDYRQKVVKKLAGIVDRCYDLDDKGHSYANDITSRWEKHIAEMEEKGVDANETAEVLWYVSKHNDLQGQPLYYTYKFYTRHDPEYFKEWTGLNEAIDKLNKAGLITEFLGFSKRKITDDETKLEAIKELFEDDSVKQTGPGKFEAKNMEDYDVITYYDWDENDTMTVTFNFMKKGVQLANFSDHLKKTIYGGNFCPDFTMSEFIDEVGELWQEC